MQPRQWQQQLIQLLRRRLELEGSSRDLLVFAGPGAGKTLGALLGFSAMRDQGRLDHFLVFCHRTSILNPQSMEIRRGASWLAAGGVALPAGAKPRR